VAYEYRVGGNSMAAEGMLHV